MGVEIVVPVVFLGGLFIMIILIRKYVNEERMAMIEKGLTPGSTPIIKSNAGVQAGMLLMGAGIGLLVAYFLDNALGMEEVAYFSMLLLFGGAGLFGSYLYLKRENKKEQ